MINIYSFQGSIEPYLFDSFFHTSFDTINYDCSNLFHAHLLALRTRSIPRSKSLVNSNFSLSFIHLLALRARSIPRSKELGQFKVFVPYVNRIFVGLAYSMKEHRSWLRLRMPIIIYLEIKNVK